MLMTPTDKRIIVIIVTLSLILYGVKYLFSDTGAYAVVKKGSEIVAEVPLTEPEKKQLIVKGRLGEATIEFRDGAVRMLEAPCPDQICVNEGWISARGEAIVCVPNEIVIQIAGSRDVDAVVK